ncbi:4-amino-4-deoxy-L-arabinose transferase-like glycosyltransferase [Tenacibaculum adriaticum]|uniref:4-amino-4-deoxy-L-arabinose transferase-like glycosyltransferase n=1 Tax=Tenacibaculum adriaticum TaxID=413713 RepID=A0A5S5DNS3_9FLAO|nr:glycosyltransferase family 39 protein [Tenacibaculum adriaticum]TYP97324.1 4-amino-4-deoxy-L-arabinose transferase-like glycosyltransferase [Tenacibaculum adriaticum]
MDFFYKKKNIKYLYILIAIVYAIGLFIPLMENDSAQHAVMAMRMYLNDNLFEFYKGPNPYLDKPHMHFWLAAISYKIFGLQEWAYRLPAILFTVLGAISTYHLTKKLYDKSIAHYGSLIFLTSQSIILANHDVRTDAVLTGAVIFSIWQFFEYLLTKKTLPIILGAVAMGIAFSTKGFYGVAIICFSLFAHIIYNKKFSFIFSYKILIAFVVFFLSITPILYAYYVQFGWDGVEFILWKQNVNRATASGFKQNSPDYAFFFHSLLWVFLPWAFLMYFGLFYQIKKWVKNGFKKTKGVEFLTIGGILIILVIISFSKFKLPHYLNPLIPSLSIFTAGVLYNLNVDGKQKTLKVFLGFVYFFVLVLAIASFLILFFTFNTPTILTVILALLSFIILILTLVKKEEISNKILVNSVLLMIFVNVVLNSYFYPKLLQYQGGMNIAKIIKEKNINIDDIYIYENNYSWSLDFYTKKNIPWISTDEIKDIKDEIWLFTKKKNDIENLKKQEFIITEKIEAENFRVTRLNLKFLNPKTRSSKTGKVYLVKIKKEV